MPYCPKCGKETGNENFCPGCGAPQGTKKAVPTYSAKRKEPYNSWIGAVICCCLTPVPAFVYYYITEPEEDSLNQTFLRVGAICGIFIGFIIMFTIFMMAGGGMGWEYLYLSSRFFFFSLYTIQPIVGL